MKCDPVPPPHVHLNIAKETGHMKQIEEPSDTHKSEIILNRSTKGNLIPFCLVKRHIAFSYLLLYLLSQTLGCYCSGRKSDRSLEQTNCSHSTEGLGGSYLPAKQSVPKRMHALSLGQKGVRQLLKRTGGLIQVETRGHRGLFLIQTVPSTIYTPQLPVYASVGRP